MPDTQKTINVVSLVLLAIRGILELIESIDWDTMRAKDGQVEP